MNLEGTRTYCGGLIPQGYILSYELYHNLSELPVNSYVEIS